MTLQGGVNFLQGETNYNAQQLPLQNAAERAPDQDELFRRNNDKLSRDIRVAIPASVVSFDAEKQTITAQPLIREKLINRQNGQTGFVTLPQLVDVPVCFARGGSCVLTMPVQPGDEVLIVFSDTNIDSWFASGGIQNWNDRRRHDLSDAIAIIGLSSQPNVISNFNENATELRTLDGEVKIALHEDGIDVVARDTSYMSLYDFFFWLQFDSNDGYSDLYLDESHAYMSHGNASFSITDSSISMIWDSTHKIVINSTGIHITGPLFINGFNYLLHTHTSTVPPAPTGPVIP